MGELDAGVVYWLGLHMDDDFDDGTSCCVFWTQLASGAEVGSGAASATAGFFTNWGVTPNHHAFQLLPEPGESALTAAVLAALGALAARTRRRRRSPSNGSRGRPGQRLRRAVAGLLRRRGRGVPDLGHRGDQRPVREVPERGGGRQPERALQHERGFEQLRRHHAQRELRELQLQRRGGGRRQAGELRVVLGLAALCELLHNGQTPGVEGDGTTEDSACTLTPDGVSNNEANIDVPGGSQRGVRSGSFNTAPGHPGRRCPGPPAPRRRARGFAGAR